MNDDHDTIWMRAMLVIAAFLILLICIGVLKANADEYSEIDITVACYTAAIEQVADAEFASEDDRRYAVGMLTAGCMYYDLMQQCYGTGAADSFAYPIEPDDEPSEFEHDVQ